MVRWEGRLDSLILDVEFVDSGFAQYVVRGQFDRRIRTRWQ